MGEHAALTPLSAGAASENIFLCRVCEILRRDPQEALHTNTKKEAALAVANEALKRSADPSQALSDEDLTQKLQKMQVP